MQLLWDCFSRSFMRPWPCCIGIRLFLKIRVPRDSRKWNSPIFPRFFPMKFVKILPGIIILPISTQDCLHANHPIESYPIRLSPKSRAQCMRSLLLEWKNRKDHSYMMSKGRTQCISLSLSRNGRARIMMPIIRRSPTWRKHDMESPGMPANVL